MATSTTPAAKGLVLGGSELKNAGVTSLQFGLATTVTIFAVQAAIIAGKVLIANGKGLATSLKS